jgi:hypothetical protein
MGLDMYLYDMVITEEHSLAEMDRSQLAYWRKANSIHAWFVDNVQSGVDDCEFYPVTVEQLKTLLDLCKKALNAPNIHESLKFLQPRSGFFFGPVDDMDWYLKDLRNTVEQLEGILKDPPKEIYYHSSW